MDAFLDFMGRTDVMIGMGLLLVGLIVVLLYVRNKQSNDDD